MGRAAKGEGSVFKTATGWRGYITVNGRRKYASGPTKMAVAQRLRELKNQRDNGVLSLGRSPALSAWLAHWMEAKKPKLKPKTYETYQAAIDRYLPAWLGAVKLDKLTAEHLEQAYAALRDDRRLADTTIYQLHAVLRGALELARRRGRIPVNVATMVVAAPSTVAKRVAPFTDAELDKIYTAIADTPYEARWTFALEQGPRPGEAIALEWSEVDFDEGAILVKQQLQTIDGELRLVQYAKSDAGRRKIPMPDYLAELLRTHRARQLAQMAEAKKWGGWRDPEEPDDVVHAFVFPSQNAPGMPITPSGDTLQWRRILDKAGVPKVRRYVARHTAASRMIAAGIDLTVVAEILGHANIQMLVKVYAHALEERKKMAAAVMDMAWRTRSGAPYVAPYSPDSERTEAAVSDTAHGAEPQNHG